MKKKLFVVESPTKCPKIKKYLEAYEPGEWRVLATVGHWRGLPDMDGQAFEEVVDVDNGFAEQWVIHESKKRVEKDLREAVRGASEVYLAADDDREGEAIAWHIVDHFDLRDARRVRCREITAKGVVAGIRNAGTVDLNLVDAQRARSVLDYLIGMQVSRLIWRFRCKSAGRLQSSALRVLVARDRERTAFHVHDFWTLRAKYGDGFEASLGVFEAPTSEEVDVDERSSSEPRLVEKRFLERDEAEQVLAAVRGARHVVESVDAKPTQRRPPPPYTTSELLGSASSRLGFSVQKTSKMAQSLFEKGAITYIRTDSTALSDEAITDIRSYLGVHHSGLLPDEPVRARQASGAQAAHEAIRPTKMTVAPSAELSDDESMLYDLIFRRTLCAQAKPAILDRTTVAIEPVGCDVRLIAHGQIVREAGWTELDPESALSDSELPSVAVGQALDLASADLKAGKTRPPPRFNERTLIRYLERRGIGRPSTYVEMIRKLRDREYIADEGRDLVPQQLGLVASDLVALGFDELTEEAFTAKIELALDAIASGKIDRVQFLHAFVERFERLKDEATTAFNSFASKHPELDRDASEPHDEPCPKCGGAMRARTGKSGRYAKCGDEACGHAVSLEAPKLAKTPCPSCGAEVRIQPYTKDGKRKTLFVCHAECGWKSGFEPPQVAKSPCPKCGGGMLVRRTSKGEFFGCASYPKCDGAAPVRKNAADKRRRSARAAGR